MRRYNQLFTTVQMNQRNPLKEYPRPQLVRDSYYNFNGEWNYCILKERSFSLKKINEYDYIERIIVPYPLESFNSGCIKELEKGDILIYKKIINIKLEKVELPKVDYFALHFGAVDQEATVIWNGEVLGENKGGYLPFSFKIPKEKVFEENILYVVVKDSFDLTYPIGKQQKNPGGIWYTQTTGIWKTVWGEFVNENAIESIQIETDIDNNRVYFKVNQPTPISKKISIYKNGEFIYEKTVTENEAILELKQIETWSPESPVLYDVVINAGVDKIKSYFGFRKISKEFINNKSILCLNNKPYYFHGVLEQGYYPEGIVTPANYKIFENEVLAMKKLGFNTLRMNVKVEADYFYYICDKLGIIVWQDMVNNGNFEYFKDSVFPLLGIKKKKMKATDKQSMFFKDQAFKTIDCLRNHPSICLWTIFNEGWGQFEDEEFLTQIKEYDKTRIFDMASGWFYTEAVSKTTDVMSKHIYNKGTVLEENNTNKPLILTECGGYYYKVRLHCFNDKQYILDNFTSVVELNQAFNDLYNNQIIPAIKNGLCGSIYTQFSDVEEEMNGIYTYDRCEMKISGDTATLIQSLIQQEFINCYGSEEEKAEKQEKIDILDEI